MSAGDSLETVLLGVPFVGLPMSLAAGAIFGERVGGFVCIAVLIAGLALLIFGPRFERESK